MAKIFNETKRVTDLSDSEKATMFGLLAHEFLGANHSDFVRDLEEKDIVMLLRKERYDGEIVGFSTQMIIDLEFRGRKVKAIFSGDTTVLEQYRSSPGLGIEMGKNFMKALGQFPEHEIFYVLISKGWRTYKVLPFFFKHFAPKFDTETQASEKSVMDAIGFLKYPREYDSKKGLIIFSRETQRLVPGSIDALPPRDPDDHIKFFLEHNPTYLSGTELVCVGRVSVDNFSAPMTRLIRSTR